MYSVLDVRTVMGPSPAQGGEQIEYNLVRLQNPWADASEWKGRCSDANDDFWTPEVKQALNSQDQLAAAGAEGADQDTLSSKRFLH